MRHKNLQKLLDKNNIKYQIITHAPAYTAQEIAARAHISGRDLAKTIIVKIDNKLAMLVGPSNKLFDFAALKKLTNAESIELASEYEFQEIFDDCEVGAQPPFGNLYDMDVYVDDSLLEDDNIAFNAGNHSELVQMRYEDWTNLVKPKVLHIH